GVFVSTSRKGKLMKPRSIFTIVLLLSLALAGCSDEDNTPQSKGRESAEVDRLNRELQKAETNVTKQESAKAWWQSIATFLAVAAIGSLVIGTIIGSSARNESQR